MALKLILCQVFMSDINNFILKFPQVTTARPNDKDAKTKFLECSKIVKRKAFENAIAVEETKKSVADSLNLETMSKCVYMSYLCVHIFKL